MKTVIAGALVVIMAAAGACTRHHVTADTTHRVEIAPIHVTVDVNLKVQKALDEALSFQGEMNEIFTEEELKQLQ